MPKSLAILLATLPIVSLEAQSTIDAATAMNMINGCAAHAKSKGQSHAIAVVDAGGHQVATWRMDGNAPGIMEFALQKAAAVAYWRFSTEQMETSAKATPGFANAPRVVTVPGGLPVFSKDGATFLGAVGVSGEAAQDDVACARAAVTSAGLSLAPSPRSK